MQRVVFRLSILLFVALFSKGALATADFPDDLKARFNIATDASQMCTYCHANLNGGRETVSQPFGRTLMKHGLTKNDREGLVRILTAMEASGDDDSDEDLVGDIAELRAGTDPNVNDITGEGPEQRRYGFYCSTPRGGAPLSATGWVWPTALLLCAWRIRGSSARRALARPSGFRNKDMQG
jgi:hypothetical protein